MIRTRVYCCEQRTFSLSSSSSLVRHRLITADRQSKTKQIRTRRWNGTMEVDMWNENNNERRDSVAVGRRGRRCGPVSMAGAHCTRGWKPKKRNKTNNSFCSLSTQRIRHTCNLITSIFVCVVLASRQYLPHHIFFFYRRLQFHLFVCASSVGLIGGLRR